MQTKIIAGDTLKFDVTFVDYPASAGWALTYKLYPTSGTVLTFSASANSDAFSVNVLAATTAGWAAAEYGWSAYVAKGSERYTVDSGRTTVVRDPSSATAADTRTHARKVVEAIEAVLEKRATQDQMRYMINGRELWRMPVTDLMLFRSQYLAEVRREEQVDRLAENLPDRRRLYIRTLRA